MSRRFRFLVLAATLFVSLMVPAATSAATAPYRWRIISNPCGYMTSMAVEFTVLPASRANNVILTGYTQQLINGKWRTARVNSRSPQSFTRNGQPHVFQLEGGAVTDGYWPDTHLRILMKLEAFNGRTLLWQKKLKGVSCPTTY